MKKQNFLDTESKRKEVKKKGMSHRTPEKNKGKSIRPSRSQGSSR